MALAPLPAHATVADFLRSQSAAQGQAIVDAASAMPPERYGRAPTADPMTFGELVLHVAVGNYLFCSRIGDTPEPKLPTLTGNEPKGQLVARLQSSFDFCNRALVSLTDARMSEVLKIGDSAAPRATAILTLTGTWNAHLTMALDYLAQSGRPVPTASR